MYEDEISIHVNERSSKLLEYNGFRVHPFQKDALEAIEAIIKNKKSKFIILRITAPVGAGKSFIMRQLINRIRGYPLIFTYPTKILLDTQINSMISELNNLKVGAVAEWDKFERKRGVNIFKYTTDEIVRMGLIDKHILEKRRGEIIAEYLMRGLSSYRLPVMATTPDVLHILYNLKRYGGRYTKRIIDFLTKSIVVFDEFHTYHNLANFYILLENLSNFASFVILLSATPYMNKSYWKRVESSYEIKTIDFRESEEKYTSSGSRRVFNKELNIKVMRVNRFSEDRSHIEPILEQISTREGLHAVIYNSIFRLRHHKSLIDKYNGVEWSGMKKEDLNNKNIVFGTSSIEVGIDLKFTTLITEVDNWVSAIQRIGRVGRRTRGEVYLLTRSFDLLRSLTEGEVYERDIFEEILQKNLPNPDKDMVAGELFRGESFNFIIYDSKIREIYPYSENIFSMYYIDDAIETSDNSEFKEGLNDLALTAQLSESRYRELEIRDRVAPFYGILYGRLRRYYVNLDYERKGRNEIVIKKPQLFIFRRNDV